MVRWVCNSHMFVGFSARSLLLFFSSLHPIVNVVHTVFTRNPSFHACPRNHLKDSHTTTFMRVRVAYVPTIAIGIPFNEGKGHHKYTTKRTVGVIYYTFILS